MKKITRIGLLIALSAISVWGFAQSTIDYETVGNSWTWSSFENGANTNTSFSLVANPAATGINTSANCARFVAYADGQQWAGFQSAHGDFGPFELTTSNHIIKIMVYKSVISPVGIKLVTATDWAQPEIKVSNTLTDQWEELTFDFSPYIDIAGQPGPYDRIVVFPDFATRTSDNTCYIDNISFPGAVPEALTVSTHALTMAAEAYSTNTFDIITAIGWTVSSDQDWLLAIPSIGTGNSTITLQAAANPNVATRTAKITVKGSDESLQEIVVTQSGSAVPDAPVPTVAEAGVKAIYSDTYTPVESTFQDWYGTTMTEVSSATPANKVEHVTSTCCFGYGFPSPLDLSSMTTLHVDLYPTTLTSITIGIVVNGDHKVTKTLTADTWNSIDIPLSDLTTTENLAAVAQTGFWDINGAFYMDNLYFYNPSVGISKLDKSGISIYPNPVKSDLFVKGLPQNATVKIFDVRGKLLVSTQNVGNQIDVNNLAKGVYSIQISGKNGITTKKFVKE